MSDEAVRIEITGRIDGKVATSIRDIARAALEADNSLDLLKQSLRDVSSASNLRAAVNDTREFKNEINRTTQAQRELAATTRQTGTALVAASRDADKLAQSMKRVEGNNRAVGQSFTTLRGIIGPLVGIFGGIFAVTEYARAQDALTGIQNKIRSITADTDRQADIQEKLFDVSNRTRTSVEATTDGFVRFSKALEGASDDEVIRFTETLNKSLISAGRTTAEVSSIVTQLGQALTSGKLMGDEFRSLSENLPVEALEAIAKQLGVDRQALKALSTEGKITAEVLRAAFADMADGADEAFKRTVPTISQAITLLQNDFIAFTGTSSAGAQFLAMAIMGIGDNLYIIIPLVVSFAAAWAAVQLYKIAAEFVLLTAEVIKFTAVFVTTNATAIILAASIGLVVVAIVTLAYAFAKITGNGEEFEKNLADMITRAKDWAGSLMGMITQTGEADTAQSALKETVDTVTEATSASAATMEELTDATNENKGAVTAWSASTEKAVDAVTNAYYELSKAKQAALSAANDVSYSNLMAQGGTSGSFTALPAFGSPGNNGGSIVGLKSGGSFRVGGTSRGVDRNLVQFRANRGEQVDVYTKSQQRAANRRGNGMAGGAPINIFNIQTPDADSFRLSRGQIAADMLAVMG